MKKLVCQILFIYINVLFLTFNMSAQSPDTRIKFRLVQDYLIIVPVQINDSETLEFVIDTGTNTSLIIPEVAARLKLRPVDRIEMMTATGSIITPRSFLPRLMLGGRAASDTEVLWSDLSEMRRLDKRISGVLGQNVLKQFNYRLDYRKHCIEFEEANIGQLLRRGVRLDTEQVDGRLLVKAQIASGKSQTLRLVLDSGTSNLVLFGSRRNYEFEFSATSQVQVLTNAGSALAQSGVIRALRLGGENLYNLTSAFVPNEMENRAEDGLLPLHLFRSVYFNNREAVVILTPY